MGASQSGVFNAQEFTDAGVTLVAGRLYTYAQGTTTLKVAYTDAAGLVPHTYTSDGAGGQYIALDVRGELPAPLYLLPGSYDLALKRADGSTVWTRRADPVADPAAVAEAGLVSFQNTLMGSTGALQMGFLQAGTGALLRVSRDKMRETVSVEDFASLTDPDDTLAIQRAVAHVSVAGGTVEFTKADYTISSAITVSSDGVAVRGKGRDKTRITQTVLGSPIFTVTGSWFKLSDLWMGYAGTPVLGATAINCTGSWSTLRDFWISNCWIGVRIATCVGVKVQSHEIRAYEQSAVVCEAMNDAFFSDFIYDAESATRGAQGGVRLSNQCEAVVMTNGDILQGVYSMTTGAAAWAAGSRPAYCNFTDVFFDSAAQGATIDNMALSTFVGCWWSGGRTAGGYPGLTLNRCDALKFVNCEFFNNGGSGALVSSQAKRVSFHNPTFNSNSVTAGAGAAHGINFADGASDFQIIGGSSGNGLYTGTQGYGIFIGTGCSNYTVTGVNVAGNATGGISDNSNAGHVSENPGFRTRNKGTATISAGSTNTGAIAHGLGYLPTLADFNLGFTTSPAASGVTSLYVSAITSTTFQINTNAAVAGASLGVRWEGANLGA